MPRLLNHHGQWLGGLRVEGWAIDPDTADAIAVHVYIDNTFAMALNAAINRPDVEKLHPGFGAKHGFGDVISISAGTHHVCVCAINASPTGEGNTELGCRSVSIGDQPDSALPIGYLDTVEHSSGSARVQGWAIDPDTVDRIVVQFYVDGQYDRQMTAAICR